MEGTLPQPAQGDGAPGAEAAAWQGWRSPGRCSDSGASLRLFLQRDVRFPSLMEQERDFLGTPSRPRRPLWPGPFSWQSLPSRWSSGEGLRSARVLTAQPVREHTWNTSDVRELDRPSWCLGTGSCRLATEPVFGVRRHSWVCCSLNSGYALGGHLLLSSVRQAQMWPPLSLRDPSRFLSPGGAHWIDVVIVGPHVDFCDLPSVGNDPRSSISARENLGFGHVLLIRRAGSLRLTRPFTVPLLGSWKSHAARNVISAQEHQGV